MNQNASAATAKRMARVLAGNGALLLAVALLFGGWDGKGDTHPVLPAEGWQASSEGFFPLW